MAAKSVRRRKPIYQERVFIGIDPGKAGAIAVIDERLAVISLDDYPGDLFGCVDVVSSISGKLGSDPVDVIVAIERAQPMPKQGVRSVFNYGTNYGDWRGVIAAQRWRILLPTPQQWRRGVVIGNAGTGKQPSVDAAAQIFPRIRGELVGPRGGLKDGRAEALLIAYWAYRQICGGKF